MAEVTRLHPVNPGAAPAELTAAELRSLLEWMGLTRPWFAERVGVQERTVIRWCDGKAPIPENAAVELVALWNTAAAAITQMISGAVALEVRGVVTLRTFRVDTHYWSDIGSVEFPASWHRALTCRAMDHLLMRTRYRVVIEYWEDQS